jgi:hypothetical protein
MPSTAASCSKAGTLSTVWNSGKRAAIAMKARAEIAKTTSCCTTRTRRPAGSISGVSSLSSHDEPMAAFSSHFFATYAGTRSLACPKAHDSCLQAQRLRVQHLCVQHGTLLCGCRTVL